MAAKEIRHSQRRPRADASRRRHPGRSGARDAGPKGRNVVLDKSYGAPRITKDGVTVAKEIELSDKFENMGAQMVKEVASKTSTEAGDGTTTATILAHAMVREGVRGRRRHEPDGPEARHRYRRRGDRRRLKKRAKAVSTTTRSPRSARFRPMATPKSAACWRTR